MKSYFKVSFEYSEGIYCTNMARAESAADVEKSYSKYNWCSVREAAPYELDEAKCKGMPIIEIEHEEPATEEPATEEPATEEPAQTERADTVERIARIRYCKRCELCGGGEAYLIEILDGSGEWVINKVHPLRMIPGDNEPNFVSYTMINDLMALSGIGYKFAPQVSD